MTGASDGSAMVWDPQKGAPRAVLRRHEASVSSVMFSLNGERVVTGAHDNTARISNAQTGSELAVLKEHNGAVRSAVFSPDGLLVATASDMARLWNAKTGEIVLRLDGGQGELYAAEFTADGKRVVTLGADRTFLRGRSDRYACRAEHAARRGPCGWNTQNCHQAGRRGGSDGGW